MTQINQSRLKLHLALASLFALILTAFLGCSAPTGRGIAAEDLVPPLLELSPGDVVEVTFPGATNLNGIHRIGPEGSITMPLVGQVQAAGRTADELRTDLTRLYDKELKDKEVLVAIAGSGNAVYVTGAVLRPAKVPLDRPLTALEAIMEAGGFAETANRKKVTVIRYEGGQNTPIPLNMDPLMKGGPVPQFFLRPRDIIHVPQKMQWF